MREFIRTFYIANGTYPMCSTFIKLALLFQYLRLFGKGTRLRVVTVITIIVVCSWGFAFTFMSWVPCLPIKAYWDWNIPDSQVTRYGFGSHEVDTFVATYLTHAATNVALDLIIFTIPIPLYMEKGIQTKTRWALCGLFVLGAIVNVCSICRLVSVVNNRAATFPTLDPSWILVTREVDVTRETRDFTTINNNWEDSDVYALEVVPSNQKPHLDQRYMLSHIDPLQEEKPTTTTVMAAGQQANGGARPSPRQQ
ncbi:hypothetical protein SLS64_013037 [Diaporthe eres]